MNNFVNYIKPVNIEGTKKILDQMTNCVCEVKNNLLIGTGFFCKIPYNNTKINVLITSYQIINEFYFNQNNNINLLMNDYNQLKIINIDPTRNIYFNKEYNTTIIELKDYDNITNFLELDDNLFGNNIKSIFENESIYILQYLNGAKAIVSYGNLNQLNGYNINHSCFINSGSNGAPILNLTNNKVIGITLETLGNLNINGIIIQYSIEDYINKYQFKLKNQMPDIFTTNFGMGMNNNFMPNMMMNNNSISDEIEDWLKGFKLMAQEVNIINDEDSNHGPKIHIIFVTTICTSYIMDFNYGTTITKMLEKYLQKIGKSHLYCTDNKICFLFNDIRLRFGDQTPIEEFFKGMTNPKILINDVSNLIG
jgi:hypothetical protein